MLAVGVVVVVVVVGFAPPPPLVLLLVRFRAAKVDVGVDVDAAGAGVEVVGSIVPLLGLQFLSVPADRQRRDISLFSTETIAICKCAAVFFICRADRPKSKKQMPEKKSWRRRGRKKKGTSLSRISASSFSRSLSLPSRRSPSMDALRGWFSALVGSGQSEYCRKEFPQVNDSLIFCSPPSSTDRRRLFLFFFFKAALNLFFSRQHTSLFQYLSLSLSLSPSKTALVLLRRRLLRLSPRPRPRRSPAAAREGQL